MAGSAQHDVSVIVVRLPERSAAESKGLLIAALFGIIGMLRLLPLWRDLLSMT